MVAQGSMAHTHCLTQRRMSRGLVQDLTHKLENMLAREPASHVELNLLLSPVAHVLLGPGPSGSDRHTVSNAIAQEAPRPNTSRAFNPHDQSLRAALAPVTEMSKMVLEEGHESRRGRRRARVKMWKDTMHILRLPRPY